MRLILYMAAILAMSPFVLAIAVLAATLRRKDTPPMGTIGEEDPIGDDPGVDVDGDQEHQRFHEWHGTGCTDACPYRVN
jgi:hypothetical protein